MDAAPQPGLAIWRQFRHIGRQRCHLGRQDWNTAVSDVPFLKMNGLGNQIIVADLRGTTARVTPEAAIAINARP